MDAETNLDQKIAINKSHIFILMIVCFALFMRLYHLSYMAYHHDESIHAYYAYKLYADGRGVYKYDPVYHGPFLYHLGALFFALFGDNDFTGRLPFVFMGVLLLYAAYKLHLIVGKKRAILILFLLSASPTMTYFSRFARNDILFGSLNLCWLVSALYFLHYRKNKYLLLTALFAVLTYTCKENSYITGFIFCSFLVFYALYRVMEKSSKFLYGLLCFVGFIICVPIGWYVAWCTTEHQHINYKVIGILIGPLALLLMLVVLRALFRKEGTNQWAEYFTHYASIVKLMVFYGIYSFCAFTFMLGRHAKWFPESGKGPIFGFGDISAKTFNYTYWGGGIFLAIIILAVLAYLKYRLRPLVETEKTAQPIIFRLIKENIGWIIALAIIIFVYSFLFTTMFYNKKGMVAGVTEYLKYWISQHGSPRIPGPWYYYLPRLLLYESAVLIFGIVAFFYYGFFIIADLFRFLGAKENETVVPRVSAFRVFMLFWTMVALIMYGIAQEKVPWLLVHQAMPLCILTGIFIIDLQEKIRWRSLLIPVMAIFITLEIFSLRNNILANIYNNDDPREAIVYTQTHQDVVNIVKEIEKIAFITGKGQDMRISCQGEPNWPMSWYLRNYKKIYWAVSDRDSPVALTDWEQRSRMQIVLGDEYRGRKYRLRAWWVPDLNKFKKASFKEKIQWLWQYAIYRDPWSITGSQNMMYYVKKDLMPTGGTELKYKRDVKYPEGYARQPISGRYKSQFGSLGNGPGQFNEPRGLDFGPDGNLFVADTNNNRIQVFSPEGKFIRMWGKEGNAPGEFNKPSGIAVDKDGFVYVADMWNARIQKFTAEGKYVTQWKGHATDFFGPREIEVSDDSKVYVSDTGNKRMQVFDTNGNFIKEWGYKGTEPGRFDEQVGVCVDDKGNVYVADCNNKRIQVFTSTGRFIREWHIMGWENFYTEPHLAYHPRGFIYATDSSLNCIHTFDLEGKTVTLWGHEGKGAGQLEGAVGIAINKNGDIYIADTRNHRIQIFNPIK